jgi:hypothetical protein
MITHTTRGSIAWLFCTLFFLPVVHARVLGHPPRSHNLKKINTLEVTPVRVWQEFANRHKASEQRVVLFCKLDIYRHGMPIRLKQLTLKWRADKPETHPPTNLMPILYQPKYKKVFNPTSHAALADGQWDARTQTINFHLHAKIMGRHQFYVVLLASNKDLARLVNGRFIYTDAYPLVTTAVKQ